MEVVVPQLAWFGDGELKLKFPEEWDVNVQVMKGHGKRSVNEEEIIRALRNPVGTKPLSRLAQGKKDVVIIFDDMTRPTKVYEVVPHVIDELRRAGIKDDNIRFVCASGSHGVFDREDFVKKLGESVVESYPVFNHNPYANLVYSGRTKYGTPVEINAEVMACDLKIAIGCIVPHPYFGYGGGAKIVLPGVASMRSICYNHGDLGGFSLAQDHRKVHPSCELAYGRVNEENVLRLDSEEAAKTIGLDMIVNVLVDLRRKSTDVFVGDVIKAQREGVEVAKEHYLTPVLPEADIVVSNAYSKASEAAIASWPVLTLKEGEDFVLIVNAPTGQVTHYVHGRWGTEVFGDLYLSPPNILNRAGRIILFSEYHERQPWLELVPPEKTVKVRTWEEVIEELKNKHKNKAKVAVYPDATIQKPF
ncbi:MAG: lactate racemase domain-containing protein [Candidatus Bathyarchaeia archaeon]